jgi:hypothetical protein
MPNRVTMNKETNWVTLDEGDTQMFAPGLSGDVTWNDPADHTQLMANVFTAAGQPAVDSIDAAMTEAGLEDRGSVTLASGAASLPSDPPKLLIRRKIKSGEIEFAIYRDESGVISLHRPLPSPPPPELLQAPLSGLQQQSATPAPSTVQPRYFHYVIPARRAPSVTETAPATAMLSGIGGKIVRFVGRKIHAVTTGLAKDAVFLAAKAWEDKYRNAQGFHSAPTVPDLINSTPIQMQPADWSQLNNNKSLLFIHGTISSTSGAFGGAQNFTGPVGNMFQNYGNRVIGFNHHTLTKSVSQNAIDFFNGLPPGDYNFDVICHSRGGLLARALKQLPPAVFGQYTHQTWSPPNGVNVQIGKIAMVATPNVGTPLANPTDLPEAISRLASIATTFGQVATAVGLGAILAVFGAVVEGGLGALPGLEDMNPGTPFLTLLNSNYPGGNDSYYAIEADYQPTGGLARAIENNGMDALFLGQKNDLVVPTLGVSEVNEVTLPPVQVDEYPQSANVYHTDFFWQQGTWDAIVKFLP